ncbi:MAG: type I glutamate--ammonia ligase [Bacillota bacterium]|nr:MAG: type I glutamate--ammonia ligase [Bacillota bacterium]
MTAEQVLELMRKHSIEYVDFRLTDVPGQWQHITIPASEVTEETFRRGIAFDGSSIRGFRGIEESDMVMVPDPSTAFIDPFTAHPTLAITCDIYLPDGQRYERDPRYVAQKAEAYLKATGIADTSYWGPELEFFIFDEVRFRLGPNEAYYFVDSAEAAWNTDKPGSTGYAVRTKQGYVPVAPTDSLQDLRSEMCNELMRIGIRVERHHHEVATGGQVEINFAAAPLVRSADNVMAYKYIVRNVARRHGKTVTFMPKPIYGDNGNGMHVHQSLVKDGVNLFWDEKGYGCLSKLAMHYLAGILYHGPALVALTNPSTNSFKRLVPGYEAPINLAFSKGNRSAAIRIPISVTCPKTARIEFRTPDCTANPYLAFAAMLMAGLDGIRKQLDPVELGFGPVDKNIYKLNGEESRRIRKVPRSLEEALEHLERDHEFLLEGGVFTEDLIQTWIDLKRAEAEMVRARPHPAEFALFFDA